ncbi:MAG: type IV pilus twitching motility protein PilT, partial [Fibrobacteres bacterium]|nr:type IV pilus twitching motility protein PilT [Fibrobacterota bacterium]
HLSAGAVPVVRVNGVLKKMNLAPLSDDEIRSIIYPLLNATQKVKFETTHEIDFAYEISDTARFRINFFEQLKGIAAVFRVIPTEIRGFEELGLPEIMKSFSIRERGLVLVTGPTGCGKSTTLAAMIDYINENSAKHIITVEDPIEFIHRNKKCLINQREVGMHTESFKSALRVAMREDPDVILVGEMRDLETVSLALTAAETGHLVLATLHTSSASKTIDRIVDIFPASGKEQIRTQLSESISGIVSQRLLPKKDGKGRALALEVLAVNTAVRNLIREDKVFQLPSIIQASTQQGMIAMDMSLLDLVQKGIISKEEAAKIAEDPGKMK